MTPEPMHLVVISPESGDPREVPAMEAFFSGGLERYHVRKPAWSAAEIESWIVGLPRPWRGRIVLHGHHALAGRLGLGGSHERDRDECAAPKAVSRSCHDIASLGRHMGRYGQIIFGPVFPSISKAGHGPSPDFPWGELKRVLTLRAGASDSRVLAIGGVAAEGLARCAELGFDGAAVSGAVWSRPDPARAFQEIQAAAERLKGARHAA